MKIKAEHYSLIKDKITALGADKIKEHLEKLKVEKEKYNSIKDINKRLRWDCFWAAFHHNAEEKNNLIKELYSYLNDEHIDTALKKIVGEILAAD